ncbi:hypothetical protein VTP01DRAFT_10930 [Rhizomucor pusillus]|uniref:uncharacterized protein n=1 Tax=Rhizomucor pusillus TaxID=4840 RepID=UPI003743354A
MFVRLMIYNGEKTIVKTGILDAPEGDPGLKALTLTFEIFTKYRASFVKPLDDVKQYHSADTP